MVDNLGGDNMTDTVIKGAVGIPIKILVSDNGVAVDLSGATVKKILLEDSTGVVQEFDAEFSTTGVDGYIQYVTQSASDLGVVGRVRVQAYLEYGIFIGYTSQSEFTVEDHLDPPA